MASAGRRKAGGPARLQLTGRSAPGPHRVGACAGGSTSASLARTQADRVPGGRAPGCSGSCRCPCPSSSRAPWPPWPRWPQQLRRRLAPSWPRPSSSPAGAWPALAEQTWWPCCQQPPRALSCPPLQRPGLQQTPPPRRSQAAEPPRRQRACRPRRWRPRSPRERGLRRRWPRASFFGARVCPCRPPRPRWGGPHLHAGPVSIRPAAGEAAGLPRSQAWRGT